MVSSVCTSKVPEKSDRSLACPGFDFLGIRGVDDSWQVTDLHESPQQSQEGSGSIPGVNEDKPVTDAAFLEIPNEIGQGCFATGFNLDMCKHRFRARLGNGSSADRDSAVAREEPG